MAYTDNDPALAMFNEILNFEELYWDNFPDKETATQRLLHMQQTRRHLVSDAFDRSSYEVHVKSLERYKTDFLELHANFQPTSKTLTYDTDYNHCLTTLKLLTARFTLRMLLHDLQQIHQDMV